MFYPVFIHEISRAERLHHRITVKTCISSLIFPKVFILMFQKILCAYLWKWLQKGGLTVFGKVPYLLRNPTAFFGKFSISMCKIRRHSVMCSAGNIWVSILVSP